MGMSSTLGILCCLCLCFSIANANAGQCIMSSTACSADSLLTTYNNTNRVGCQERCVLVTGCQNFTWWSDSSSCQLFSACDKDSQEDCHMNCRSGSVECGVEGESVALISGGLDTSTSNEVSTIAGVTVVSANTVCSVPNVTAGLVQLPRHRWGHVSAFVDSKFLVCGGSTELTNAPNNTCDMFSLDNMAWGNMEDMREYRHQAAGVGLLGKFYMTGGVTLTDTSVNTTEVWDPFTMTWTPGPEMPLPLFGHCVVKHRDSFIVIGGTISETSESNMIFSYNVTSNSMLPLGFMMISRTGHGCSMNENTEEIIVTGGRSLSCNGTTTKRAERITFVTPTQVNSAEIEPLPVKLSHHAQVDNSVAQVYGGDVSNVGRNFVIEYHSTWEMTNVTLPENLSYHHVTKYPACLVTCG